MDNSTLVNISEHTSLPVYIYSRALFIGQAKQALEFKAPYGLSVRYAMKANPHPEVLQLFNKIGLKIDTSSEYEVRDALRAGIPANDIALNSQQLPDNLGDLLESGIFFTATSLHQIEQFARANQGGTLGIRLNPGDGSGATKHVTTGGKTAGFGIWHEYIPEVKTIVERYGLTISKVHTHIGAGTDPLKWQAIAATTLDLAAHFPTANTVSLGGGFKVARVEGEHSADLEDISSNIYQLIAKHAEKYGQPLHLEIEPGTYLTANAGVLLARVIDIVDTGSDGYTFLRINTGMNDILRPTLYGAQHPIRIIPMDNQPRVEKDYLVIGHNCESGDILTPAPGDPEGLLPRRLTEAKIGDLIVIGGAGAYCASMRARGYNSYPDAHEFFID